MKTSLVWTLILFTFSLFILLPHTAAVDTTKFGLPEGAVARLGKGYPTSEILYSPDGNLIAVAYNIGIWLYDAHTLEEQTLFMGHTEAVTCVAFSPDGETLASGSSDTTVRLWNVETGTEKATLIGHTQIVNSVVFSPDGKTLATGSWDYTVRLWDVETETEKARQGYLHPNNVLSVSFSPDGKTLAIAFDNSTRLQDVATGRDRAVLDGGRDVSFSPDGKTLAILGKNRDILLWDAETGIQKATLVVNTRNYVSFYSVSFSSDGETLAGSGSERNFPRTWLWNVETETQKATPEADYEADHGDVSFSPDGKTLAIVEFESVHASGPPIFSSWVLYDVETRTEKARFIGYGYVYPVCLDFSPDGKTLASGSTDTGVRLWDVPTRTEKAILIGHTGTVSSISFSPDRKTLASGGGWYDGTVRLWDVSSETEKATLTGHTNDKRDSVISSVTGVSFSPDGKTLASSSSSSARLWNVEAGIQEAIFDDPFIGFGNATLSPDGETLATSGGYTARLWDVETGTLKATLTGHTDIVNSVAFSPDGKALATASWDYTVRLWDVETGTPKMTLTGHTGIVNSVAFSPDGKTLASGGGPHGHSVRLWDVETGKEKIIFMGHTHSFLWDSVNSVAFSPDGKTLASASNDGTILLWEFSSLRTVQMTPSPIASPAIGEHLTVQVSVAAGSNIGGYQATVQFDPTVLRYVESTKGDYLPTGAFFVPPVVNENSVQLAGTSLSGVSSKAEGILATLTFEVLAVKESTLSLSDVILTDSDGEHLLHLTVSGRVVKPDPLPSSAIVSVIPASVRYPEVDQTLIFNAEIVGGQNIADYEIHWHYDETVLEYVSGDKGSYVPEGGVGNGDGTLAMATFRVKVLKTSTVSVSGTLTAVDGLPHLPTFESAQVIAPVFGDVNRDGQVNIQDLVLVASSFGQPVPTEGHPADVNEDGQINIVDLVKVAGALGTGTAAPLALNQHLAFAPTRAEVEQWLTHARQANLTDAVSQRGIRFLEQLLAVLTPKETVLLANYPNPFNPETWIPYQLATPANVTVTIYDIQGRIVRTLNLGHQAVGIYESRSRAAYWDGKNAVGEPVASGVYFYTLSTESTRDSVTAGDFTATRKMLIRK